MNRLERLGTFICSADVPQSDRKHHEDGSRSLYDHHRDAERSHELHSVCVGDLRSILKCGKNS